MKSTLPLAVLLCVAVAVAAAAAFAAPPAYPDTPKIPVAETYHDVTVADPYRWLENDTAADGDAMVGRAERAHPPLPRRAAAARRHWRAASSS